MSSWREAPPPRLRIGPLGWLRVGWRGGLIGSVTYGGLLVLLLVRLVEWPLCGQARPVTPWITQAVCRFALWVLGLPLVVHGRPMTAPVCLSTVTTIMKIPSLARERRSRRTISMT